MSSERRGVRDAGASIGIIRRVRFKELPRPDDRDERAKRFERALALRWAPTQACLPRSNPRLLASVSARLARLYAACKNPIASQ
jgi:hypothetical protein